MSTSLTHEFVGRLSTVKRIVLSAATACALSASSFAASAQATPFKVVGTGGTLHVRTAPNLTAAIVGSLSDGTAIDIVCQTTGDRVGSSSIWDRIDQPVTGYVADWYTDTPGVGYPSQGLPTCGSPPPSFASIAASYNGQREVPASIARAWHVGPHWSGYCEAFVGLVTLRVTGHGRGFGSALADYYAHRRSGLIHGGVPPAGTVVYWNPPGSGSGHIGVSLGNGMEISTYGFAGWDSPIQIHSYRYFANYLGWAMP